MVGSEFLWVIIDHYIRAWGGKVDAVIRFALTSDRPLGMIGVPAVTPF